MQNITGISNDLYTRVDVPDEYKMDVKSFLERPFFVESIDFPQTANRYSLLNNTVRLLPGDIIRSNPSLLAAMKMAAYYRADLVLNISMAGTITHAGCVLVGAIPPIPHVFNGNSHMKLINTILSGPHCFLNANEATSVNLSIPWYCNTDLATLDMELPGSYKPSLDITPVNGNYATLVLLVLNPLRPSTGSSTSLSIIVEACFKRLEISVPSPRFITWLAEGLLGDVATGMKGIASGLLDQGARGLKSVAGDAIDAGRQAIFGWTGLHNPNKPVISERIIVTERNFLNNVDTPQFFEKLDPNCAYDRIVKQPIFGTDIDEMRIPHIVGKKQMIGTISISTTDNVGKLLWSRPISPYQGGMNASSPVICNNIELLHHISRGWRGGLKLHFKSVMNNKQQVKIKVLKLYNPSLSALTSYPQYQSIVNAPSHLLEFTEGGQEQEVKLDYLCRNDITPCARDLNFEALFHGMYYVFVAQPLVVSDGSPTTVEINVFLSGDEDLTFYGYSTEIGALPGFDVFETEMEENEKIAGNSVTFNYKKSKQKKVKDLVKTSGGYKRLKYTQEVFVVQNKMTLTQLAYKVKVMLDKLRKRNPFLRDKKDDDTVDYPDRIYYLSRDVADEAAMKQFEQSVITNTPIVKKVQFGKVSKLVSNAIKFGKNEDCEIEQESHETISEESDGVSEDEYESESASLEEFIIKEWKEMQSQSLSVADSEVKNEKPKKKKKRVKKCKCFCGSEYSSESLTVMNEPQTQTDQDMKKDTVKDFNHIDRLKPNVDIRPYIRRMYKYIGNLVETASNGTTTVAFPLTNILGEDPQARVESSSPIAVISNMYYGKTAGFKVVLKTTVTSVSSTNLSPNYTVYVRYLPPNMQYSTDSNTVLACNPNLNLDLDSEIFDVNPNGVFPLPIQMTPSANNTNTGSQVYEFVVPDVTYYKFMGSPNKLASFATPVSNLSTYDFGHLLISIHNPSTSSLSLGLEMYAGLTDESRLGFHCIAPQIQVPTYIPVAGDPSSIQTMYLGNGTTNTKPPKSAINTYIYKGGFL